MESKTARSLNRRVIQNFMDIIILKHLKNNHPMSGYDVIRYFHKEFHMLLSSGTVYSLLYSMERQKLIEGRTDNGKRVYKLTNQGQTLLSNLCTLEISIRSFLSHIFSGA